MPSGVTEATICAELERVPGLEQIRAALAGTGAWLVGGSVRDLALGREIKDVDILVDGDAEAVAARLGGEAKAHGRFGTVCISWEGLEVDLAEARSETYAHPGALPDVRPGSLSEDLARRDFSVNAMAISLSADPLLEDPHGGLADLEAGLIRVLHDHSLVDDPTRAIRAARYVTRLGFELEPKTAEIIRAADLQTVSPERVEGELRKLAREPEAPGALRVLIDWGLAAGDPELGASALRVAAEPRFALADAEAAFLMAGVVKAGDYQAPSVRRARDLASTALGSPAELTKAARGLSEVELVVARALGADWVDRYVDDWRRVRLEIGGDDLIAAGIAEGPAVGAGLAAALAAKINGEISGREAELKLALRAARE